MLGNNTTTEAIRFVWQGTLITLHFLGDTLRVTKKQANKQTKNNNSNNKTFFVVVRAYLGINSMKLMTNVINHIVTADKYYTPR